MASYATAPCARGLRRRSELAVEREPLLAGRYHHTVAVLHLAGEDLLGELAGNSNWKIDPPSVRGDTQIRPSWFSMIERQMTRPIPIPFALVVKNGLKTRSMLDGSIPVPVSSIETRT